MRIYVSRTCVPRGGVTIDALIGEALSLQAELLPSLDWSLMPDSPRTRLSRALALIAFEHGSGLLELTRAAKYTSATSLMRLQYEALVRSVWLFYCASGVEIERLSDESRVATNQKLPGIVEMLESLARAAPASMVAGLVEFREYSWKPLSSYIHSGIHAVRWSETGFPRALLQQTVRASDGLLVYTAMHLADLSGDPANGVQVVLMATRYPGCLPPHRGAETAG